MPDGGAGHRALNVPAGELAARVRCPYAGLAVAFVGRLSTYSAPAPWVVLLRAGALRVPCAFGDAVRPDRLRRLSTWADATSPPPAESWRASTRCSAAAQPAPPRQLLGRARRPGGPRPTSGCHRWRLRRLRSRPGSTQHGRGAGAAAAPPGAVPHGCPPYGPQPGRRLPRGLRRPGRHRAGRGGPAAARHRPHLRRHDGAPAPRAGRARAVAARGGPGRAGPGAAAREQQRTERADRAERDERAGHGVEDAEQRPPV
jgi:hypothetical protein